MLHGLDLFSGIGGISLALQPWVRTVCYVENEPYCQQVLRERIADGRLDDAPIWDDVCSFDPRPWRGLVDIVAGGFPCQDISTAGRGAGLAGERSGLFAEIVRIAGVLRPRFIFLENVAAITAAERGGWEVVGALAALGYDARWGVLSAADVGAPHLRERWWCLAHAASQRSGSRQNIKRKRSTDQSFRSLRGKSCGCRAVPHPAPLHGGAIERGEPDGVLRGVQAVADASSERRGEGRAEQSVRERRLEAERPSSQVPQPSSAGLPLGQRAPGERAHAPACGDDWWAVEPDVGRVADGIPARVDRLRGLGNSVVPQCAREAFRRLLTGEDIWLG